MSALVSVIVQYYPPLRLSIYSLSPTRNPLMVDPKPVASWTVLQDPVSEYSPLEVFLQDSRRYTYTVLCLKHDADVGQRVLTKV